MTATPLRLTIHTDGGCRGNPGPAAAAYVIRTEDGVSIREAGIFIGRATNNIAEYQAVVAALRAAEKIGADEVDVFSDSELLVRQMNGQYRVRNGRLRPLYEQACNMAGRFSRCTITHVRREANEAADRLANQALDLKRNVGDADV